MRPSSASLDDVVNTKPVKNPPKPKARTAREYSSAEYVLGPLAEREGGYWKDMAIRATMPVKCLRG